MTTKSNIILTTITIISCLSSITFLLYGLLIEGPAFYNGQECSMTYSHFQFLPIHVHSSESTNDNYRLLKFTDARDPRHQHFYPVSGSMIENYETQKNQPKNKTPGRSLEYMDNWCLLPSNITNIKQWKKAPYPYRGHPVLYVPGHWGSFSQARSIGAHGTRWTGRSQTGTSYYSIYDSFMTGKEMHDGTNVSSPRTADLFVDWYQSSYSLSNLNQFVMDVYSLDFNEEGAALHSSKLLRQTEYFARAVETIVEGCQLSDSGVTIVAHSIGAWVVRIALKMYPHLIKEGWIQNVITLASPLGVVPYAVDAGVHDIARHLNDDDRGHDNVTFISISGGIRDEMIPPEVCDVPSSRSNSANEAFLAATIMNVDNMSKYQYGMDHRAIVWCYDLLKVVREVIFALVVTSDHDMTPLSRRDIARRILLGNKLDSKSPSFKTDTKQQRNALVIEKSYMKAVAIQLAALYHLNSLLKLTIAVLLLDLHVLPFIAHWFGVEVICSGSLLARLKMCLFIPLLVLTIFSIRCTVAACRNHECEMLHGTVFVLAQLSCMIYLLIRLVACLVASCIRKCSKWKEHNAEIAAHRRKFPAIVMAYFVKELRLLFVAFSLVVGGIHTFNRILSGDLVWTKMSVASYFFISIVTVQMWCIVSSFISLAGRTLESEFKITLILLLSTVHSTYSTVLYAISTTTQWGQIDSSLYDKFLSITKSSVGLVFGHHNELIICCVTKVIPTFVALNAVCVYTNMYIRFTSSVFGNKYDNEASRIKDIATEPIERYRSLILAKAILALWYTWNVFVSFSWDTLLLPAYTSLVFATYYLKSILISPTAIDIYGAVLNDDLFLCCNVAKHNTKKE